MMSSGLSPESPAAKSICTPYGINPCMVQEKVSSMLAALRLSTPNLSPIFLEIFPTVRIATVLLAVQIFTIETRAAIDSSAPLLLFT